ncbi:hypothetical protein HNP84_007879 [Thermocatellispora tengchongensis]|uniref:Uncharacterized protein n=1 Tax=Thermocatellispora tengchongensis TaxID=1073253 RepID=A0A840PH17_9ACTN|nr:hypothetical protein [Thermocatellispora tengchongensis]MBB5138126.1 hypothetical protein [Thermocatellispora tengchongensis]
MTKGRQADSARRRERVLAALERAAAEGGEITVAGIARAACVDRTFIYRHPDLLALVRDLDPYLDPGPSPAMPAAPAPTVAGSCACACGCPAPHEFERLAAQVAGLQRQLIALRMTLESAEPGPAMLPHA